MGINDGEGGHGGYDWGKIKEFNKSVEEDKKLKFTMERDVRQLSEDEYESRFGDHTKADCCKVGCGRTVTLHLVHEDEEMISYSGACESCGTQYNLTHMKEES